MRTVRPSPEAVKQVMRETGMQEMQAIRHLEQRMWLQGQARRDPRRLPICNRP